MPKQQVVVAAENQKAIEFLTAYFSDTLSVPTVIRSKAHVSRLFLSDPDFVFFEGSWSDRLTGDRLTKLKKECPKVKCFSLGSAPNGHFSWDGEIELPIEEKSFRKILFGKVRFPDPLKLMIVDDEPEVIEVIQDYFEVRRDPSFQVRTACNGLEAFKLAEQEAPHCFILDLKMPVRSGVELYRDLARSGRRIPTVIFIDSTVADDILEIRKWGAPVFVEKGGPSSAMPDMLALVKTLVAFS